MKNSLLARPTAPTFRTIRIVLIEDNDDDAYLIEDALTDRHLLLRRFTDGEAALEALANGEERPDVILVDFRLPSMDGVEIIRSLTTREDALFSFIMLTADTRIETAIEAMKAGARDFHPKTWGFDQLPEIIERVYRLHRDLVEKREVQEALNRSERLLSFAIEQVPIPILVAEADSGTIAHINQPARDLAQLPDNETRSFSVDEIVHQLPCRLSESAPPREENNPLVAAYHHGVEKHNVELLSADGRRWVSASAAPLCDESGRIVAVIGAYPDVTEQKNASLQLAEINASKDRFFSIVGHDLRNPVAQIDMVRQVLEARWQDLGPDDIAKFLQRLGRGCDNLLHLLESLLQWGRLQTGNVEYAPVPVNLATMLVNVVVGFEEAATAKGIKLRMDRKPIPRVIGDTNMLQTVIRNLVSNAIKFTNEGGTVRISARSEDELVAIEVADTGVGMPPDRVAGLFAVSDCKVRTGTAGESGSGLGLLLCRDLVRTNGGTIEVSSEVHVGTTITVRLPAELGS